MNRNLFELIQDLDERLQKIRNRKFEDTYVDLLDITDYLFNNIHLSFELDHIEQYVFEKRYEFDAWLPLIIKMARSKRIIDQLKKEWNISIIKELSSQKNVTAKEIENEISSIQNDMKILTWLIGNNLLVNWKLFIVCDTSVQNSLIHSDSFLKEGSESLQLIRYEGNQTAWQKAKKLNSGNRGELIKYGISRTVELTDIPNHIIISLERDQSIKTGQMGLLIDQLLNENKNVVVASELIHKEMEKYYLPGKLNDMVFNYIRKQMIPQLNYLKGMVSGTLALRSEVIREILTGTIDDQETFYLELLLRAEIRKHLSVGEVHVENENRIIRSDRDELVDKFKRIINLYFKYLPQQLEKENLISKINAMHKEEWNKWLEGAVKEIGKKDDFDIKMVEDWVESKLLAT